MLRGRTRVAKRAPLSGGNILDSGKSFDYIVVGAGSAGCLLASRLSEDPKHRVLLIEAGGLDRQFWINMPIGYAKNFYEESVNWKFQTEACNNTSGRDFYWPRGKVLGGSSALNALVYIRGNRSDYEDWEKIAGPAWGWESVFKSFLKTERHSSLENRYHSNSGLLPVYDPKSEIHPICEDFIVSLSDLGVGRNDDFNSSTQIGAGAYHFNTLNGVRGSAYKAFIEPFLDRENLTIETECQVNSILFEGKRAAKVRFKRKSKEFLVEVSTNKEIILTAGSIGSPMILMQSGIGDASSLKNQGIDVLVENSNVGQNLQDHLLIAHYYKSHKETLNRAFSSIWSRGLMALRYFMQRKGPLALSTNHCGAFVSTTGDSNPDIQLYFNPLSYDFGKDSRGNQVIQFENEPGFCISASPCRPKSIGHLELTRKNDGYGPKIFPNYLSDERDIDGLLRGSKFVRRISEETSLKNIVKEEISPGLSVQSDNDFIDDIRKRCSTVYHPVSTCRMGLDPSASVVDEKLRVFGVSGLRVADASVFPTMISGNINAPTYMVAEKAAEFILEDQI